MTRPNRFYLGQRMLRNLRKSKTNLLHIDLRSQIAGTRKENTLFQAGELKENHAEIQNTFIEEKDNRFRSLGGGHTALLSYHSHRGYFKAPNCKNYAVF